MDGMSACPICGKPARARAENASAPFCNPRCKQIDLGKWLDEAYRVPLADSSDEVVDVNREDRGESLNEK
jgi:endogenous inhibitor of DNA gyrase (YacG/DUF329 family)